jgi:hypothetical protein
MHHLGSGNRFFWLDRPRKISLPRAQRTGIHACIRRATSSIRQTTGVNQLEVAGVDAATRVWHTHVHGNNENALRTNIIQHL